MFALASQQLVLLLAMAAASTPQVRAEDPNLPPMAILAYFPAISSAVTIGVLFLIVTIALQWRIQHTKPRIWYGLTLSISGIASAAGWLARIALRKNVADLGLYIITTLLVILPPAAIIAFAYITYGRVIVAVDPTCATAGRRRAKSRYSFIPPRLVTIIFVTSDITTFCIQAVGGAMASQQTGPVSDAGNWIFLAGVALQGASYFLFIVLVIFAWFKLREYDPTGLQFFALRSKNPHLHPVVPIFQTIAATSIFIVIRSVFRIVEMAEGYRGNLMSSEVYLIVLDAVPVLITCIIWAIFWPAKALEESRQRVLSNGASAPQVSADSDADLEKMTTTTTSPHLQGDETPRSARPSPGLSSSVTSTSVSPVATRQKQ